MKPTHRDSYESLWNALHEIDSAAVFLPTFEVTHDGGIEAVTKNIVDAIKKAVVALERFGAGGGEPVAWMGIGKISKTPQIVAFSQQTVQEHGVNVEIVPLCTHPSPTDLQSVRDRALDDAAAICRTYDCSPRMAAAEIEALKGKQ